MSNEGRVSEGGARPLSECRAGASVSVHKLLAGDDDVLRLKRMGICVGRRLRVVRTGDPLIVNVVGARLGVSRRLTDHVLVADADDH